MTHFVTPTHLTPYSPNQAAGLGKLWPQQRRTMLGLWSGVVASVLSNPPQKGTGAAFQDPRVFIKQARRGGNVAALMEGLEGLFAHDRAQFEAWLWTLITDVRPSLAYDLLVRTLDGRGTGYSRRLAALIQAAASGPVSSSRSPFAGWARVWRSGLSGSRGTPSLGASAAILLVPGRSRVNGHWSDASASGPSRRRARGAMPTLEWLLKRHGPRGEVLVVCSGGTVKSPTPESAFIASELQHQMSAWTRTQRNRVRIHQDPLARHSGTNARALDRIALLSGASAADVWIVTSPGHFPRFWPTSLRSQWNEHALSGLRRADRDAIRRHFPLTVRVGTPLIQAPPAHRSPLVRMRSTALVPAPGNALDP